VNVFCGSRAGTSGRLSIPLRELPDHPSLAEAFNRSSWRLASGEMVFIESINQVPSEQPGQTRRLHPIAMRHQTIARDSGPSPLAVPHPELAKSEIVDRGAG